MEKDVADMYRPQDFWPQEKSLQLMAQEADVDFNLSLIAHSPLSADHSHCLQRECEGRCVFHLFNSIFVRKPDEKKDLRICRCAGGVGVRDDRVGRGKKF